MLKFVSGHLVRQYHLFFCVFILIYYLLWCCSLILLSGDIKTNPGPISNSRQCLSIYHWNLNSITAHNYAKVIICSIMITLPTIKEERCLYLLQIDPSFKNFEYFKSRWMYQLCLMYKSSS